MSVLRLAPELIWLVPLLPLLAAGATALRIVFGRDVGDAAERPTARLTEIALLGGLLLLLACDLLAWREGWPGVRQFGVWFASGYGQLGHWQGNVSFLLDALSLPVATLVALLGWLCVRFSTPYLHREAGFQRFFLVLALFLAGMQLVVLSGNGLIAFFGWELCGVASFLLIGYAWKREVATGNALFAFVTNRAGDAGFLLAIGFAAAWLGTFEWTALTGGEPLPPVTARLLLAGFVVAALCKSAQLPFSPWIARALEGPTPSSAIFYGALLIHAGVFLLLRLAPLLAQVPDLRLLLVFVGGATAVYAGLCALVQSDVKSGLIFGTLFQVSLMFVAIGLGWTTLATVHLCLHAVWRTWQFLLAPSWLELEGRRPAPPPAWLAGRVALYTAALQRFWLDRLGLALLVAPTQSFARDARNLDERGLDRLLGEPGQGRPVAAELPLIRADGLPGRLLARLAETLQAVEQRLSLRGRDSRLERLLRELGNALRIAEHLLEQPRYLMMAVMATFVVIL